jgi:hypothetical protein
MDYPLKEVEAEFLAALDSEGEAWLREMTERLRNVPKSPRYAYARANGNGYRLALMGFDFTDLPLRRKQFAAYLRRNGVARDVAEREAAGLRHSWEFAASTSGKSFFQTLPAWRGTLDLTPGSDGLKLFDEYQHVRGYHLPGEHDQQSHAGEDQRVDDDKNYLGGGSRLPSMVYRGGSNQNTSESFPAGVYVSTNRDAAKQWGPVVEHKIVKQPRLLDLGNWHSLGAKSIVARLTGQRPGGMDFNDYDQAAAELFIQMPDELVRVLRKNGFDGARFGQDAFLIGKLDDYTKNVRRHEAYQPNDDEAIKVHHQREMTKAERRCDFAAIKKQFDEDALKIDLAMREPIKTARDALLAMIRQWGPNEVTPEFIQSVKLTTGPELGQLLNEYLLATWRKNRDLALAELPEGTQARLAGMRKYHLPGQHDQQTHAGDDEGNGGEYNRAGKVVSGLKVRSFVPNQDSIAASLTDYEILPGIREVPLASFDPQYQPVRDDRTKALAEQIKASGEINPLIVAVDSKGPYIIEGGHRFDAMYLLGVRSFPAMVVIDKEADVPRFKYAHKYHLPGEHDQQSHAGDREVDDYKRELQADVDQAPIVKRLRDAIVAKEDHVYRIITGREYDNALKSGVLVPGYAADTGGTVNFSKEPIPLYGGSAVLSHGMVVEVPESAFDSPKIYPGSKDLYLSSAVNVPLNKASRAWGIQFVKEGIKVALLDRVITKKYASAFKPDVAERYLKNRALAIQGIVDDDLTKQVKLILFNALKAGRHAQETMGELAEAFFPWVGDPEKIVPSGVTGTQEDILQAYRLENIVRTETSTAMSEGRAAVADAAADYVRGYELSAILDERTCFRKGALIKLGNGKYAPIETITPGTTIISGAGHQKRVIAAWRYPARHWRKITVADGRSVICTYTHPFWTQSGWREAVDCTPIETHIGTESWERVELEGLPTMWPEVSPIQQQSAQVLLKSMLYCVGTNPLAQNQTMSALRSSSLQKSWNKEDILQPKVLDCVQGSLDRDGMHPMQDHVSSDAQGNTAKGARRKILQPKVLLGTEGKSDKEDMSYLQEGVFSSYLQCQSLYGVFEKMWKAKTSKGNAAKNNTSQMPRMQQGCCTYSNAKSDKDQESVVQYAMSSGMANQTKNRYSMRYMPQNHDTSAGATSDFLFDCMLYEKQHAYTHRANGRECVDINEHPISKRGQTQELFVRFSDRRMARTRDGWSLLAQQEQGEGCKKEYCDKECGVRVIEIPMQQRHTEGRRITSSHIDHAVKPTATKFIAVVANEAIEEPEWAYDIEVECDHTYIANGLIVHNTTACELADGEKFMINDPRAKQLMPPLHWNCRTVPIFLTTDDEPIDWSSDEELDAVIDAIPKGFK